MSVKKVGVLFPGQGACYSGVLMRAGEVYPEVNRVFADVDAVAAQRLGCTVSATLWDQPSKPLGQLVAEAPDVLQLAIFGTSVAMYRVLEAEGLEPAVLMGHSFGEIAALVCGGAFSVTDGAHIVCERIEACRLVTGDGYMAALGASRAAASMLTELLGNHEVVVAGENSDTQTVLSGVRVKMDRAAEIARILNTGFYRLNSPYPFHSPLMEPVRADFARRLQRYSARPLTVPVFSPILGRYYDRGDSLTECLATHLVQPVAFAAAVRTLHADGVCVLVESGALDALTKLAAKVLAASDLTNIVCLPRDGDDAAAIARAVETLRALGLVRADRRAPLTSAPAPLGLRPAEAEEFWSECGPAIRDFVDRAYARFRERHAAVEHVPPARPNVEAAASPTVRAAAPVPSASPSSASAPIGRRAGAASRDTLFRELVSMYAAALEYPEEVFTEHVELEAELGIDSVKQTELLARVAETYHLPPRPPEFRLADYHTMGRVVDFVHSAVCSADSPAAPAAVAAAPPAARPIVTVQPAVIARADLFRELATMYAAALEYPVEVFTEHVELEAELGIDSVKQTELLARAAEQYGLPPRPPDFRLADYGTMAKVVDFIHGAIGGAAGASRLDGMPPLVPLPGEISEIVCA